MRSVINKKENSFWNKMWVNHARPFGKKLGHRRKRRALKVAIKNELYGSQNI